MQLHVCRSTSVPGHWQGCCHSCAVFICLRFGLQRLLLHSPPSLPVPVRAACLTYALSQEHCKAQVAALLAYVAYLAYMWLRRYEKRGLSPPHPVRGKSSI